MILPSPIRWKSIYFREKSIKVFLPYFCLVLMVTASCARKSGTGPRDTVCDTVISDTIQYHPVRLDREGIILPWYSADPGESYDTVISLVWNFWINMESCVNGLRYYMNHQVWKPDHDMRGLGGDQINMALSSWGLLYRYTGNPAVIENMRYMADEYLARSLSDASCAWPHLPYPYNTGIHSGIYNGDMRNGKGILQPDKAGNFGYELVNLYKITGQEKYLDAAVRIARVLAGKTREGNENESPLPFRVNAKTGESGLLLSNRGDGKVMSKALYTSNWTCTMMLFQEMMELDPSRTKSYRRAFDLILAWMKEVPLKTNKWGPFFEDIPGWSDTQTNAVSFAMFIMLNREMFPDWQDDVRGIFEWTYRELGNHEYDDYGVTVMNEQTVYRVPGNSHTSRQASMELWYTALSGDSIYFGNAVRALHWATYTVAGDGRNRYIRDDIWLTDGYGDYVRHYLRAMAACPRLAPGDKNKLLYSSSVVKHVEYAPERIRYITWDPASCEMLRLTGKPVSVKAGGAVLNETEFPGQRPAAGDKSAAANKYAAAGWTWEARETGGILRVRHAASGDILIEF